MDNYDAFSAGVEIGGLRSRQEIKLLICYLCVTLDKPLTKDQLNWLMQDKGIANYFDVNQALAELVGSANIGIEIREDGAELLYITEIGAKAYSQLKEDLPRSVREKALDAAVCVQTRERREQENAVEITPAGDGFNVGFTVSAGEDILMSLTLYAADEAQAAKIKERFYQDPVKLYSGIIAALTA